MISIVQALAILGVMIFYGGMLAKSEKKSMIGFFFGTFLLVMSVIAFSIHKFWWVLGMSTMSLHNNILYLQAESANICNSGHCILCNDELKLKMAQTIYAVLEPYTYEIGSVCYKCIVDINSNADIANKFNVCIMTKLEQFSQSSPELKSYLDRYEHMTKSALTIVEGENNV